MGRSRVRTWWDASPRGLLGMLALVVLVEGYVARRALDFTTPWAADWKMTGKAAKKDAARAEVLCFGDSLAKFGVMPKVIEEQIGRPSYNLAMNVGMAPASFFLFRRTLESGGKPSAVLVDFKPHLLAHDPGYMVRQWPELLDTRESLDLCWTARDATLFGNLTAARILPSYKDRFEIRANVMDAFKGIGGTMRHTISQFGRNWRLNRGAQVMPRNPAFRGNDNLWEGDLYPTSWACHPVNESYLRRFLALAASRDVPVFWVIMPPSVEVQARRDRCGADTAYEAFVRSVLAEHPTLTVIDGRRSGYDHTVHYDPIHLDRRGAAALTADVSHVVDRHIRSRSGGPRWEALPAYHDRPIDDRLEDVEQSKVALKAERANRKRR
jgi:hypothetical protein